MEPKQEGNQGGGVKVIAEIKIVYSVNEMGAGRVEISGPIHDDVLMYGLLQKAADIVSKSSGGVVETKNKPKLSIPNMMFIPKAGRN